MTLLFDQCDGGASPYLFMHKTFLTCGLVGGIFLCSSSVVRAQESTGDMPAAKAALKKAPKPADAAVVPSVTVAGERPTNRIDRQVYDVKSDVSSTNGTAADALNNVPSVAVDPDGTVTLRGSSNVQILIDGKPSAMLQGDNRGPTLNAMAADDIESVEVINNPGAQFGNEAGGGPILNLVMRRIRKPGGFATVNANGGTAGRYNSAVSGSYNEGAWGVQGGVNLRHDGRNSTGVVSRDALDPITGGFDHSSQTSIASGLNDMLGLNGTVSYNLNANDTLTASVAGNARSNDQRGIDNYTQGDSAGAIISQYQRSTAREGDNRSYSGGGRYDHKGALPGETLKLDLRVSSAATVGDSHYANVYAVAFGGAVDNTSRQHSDAGNRIVDFSGDYERPAAGGTAKLGFKAARTDDRFDTVYTDIDPLTAAESLNAGRSNRFKLEETTMALYGTYQLKLSERWGALAGLRTEYTDIAIGQTNSGAEAKNSYTNYIPSAYATYKVSDDTNLRFAYAHRLRRPSANDLNPNVVYRDEFNVSSGNPKLKPTQTDSFEMGYETRVAGLETNLRAYYRRDKDAIVDYRYFIADNVLLTTRENGAGSHASGLEFTLMGKLTPSLTLNTSGNLARSEQITQDTTGLYITRSATSLSGRVRLNYQVDAATQLQTALQMRGRTLSGLGYRSPNETVNLSLRHALTPRLNLVMNMTDVFNTNKIETVVDSDALRETSTRRFDGRLIYIGLSYRLGGIGSSGEGKSESRQGPGNGARRGRPERTERPEGGGPDAG